MIITYRPSVLALGAIHLISKFNNMKLNIDLYHIINSSEDEMKMCATDCFLLWNKVRNSTLTSAFSKYANREYYNVAYLKFNIESFIE